MPPLRLPERIETERLLLRTWRMEDAVPLRAALGESVDHLKPWIPWAPAGPPSPEETQDRLRAWIGERAAGANCIYAVFERSRACLVGGVGLYDRVGPGAIEIGYWIRATEAGSGFATEAARALTRAGFAMPGIVRVEIHIDAANLASGRVPEKLGYALIETRRNDRVRDGEPGDTIVFALSRAHYDSGWDAGFQGGSRSGRDR